MGSMVGQNIAVLGGGIAAACCRQLLRREGVRAVAASNGGRSDAVQLPAILLSSSTQKLLADIFEVQAEELFRGMPRTRKRVVLWGGSESVELEHSGVVASEEVLLQRLQARLGSDSSGELAGPGSESGWRILAAKDANDRAAEQVRFGSRMALVSEVELVDGAEQDACWVESVESGWLFLLATGEGTGSLICVGGETERLSEKSKLVARQVRRVHGASGEFAAYPRMAVNVCGDNWLACGGAAMTFDPLCGEGAGNAAREAILACAAMRAIAEGECVTDVLGEHSLRLLLGFARHLENCRGFYVRDTAADAFWNSELRLIEEGISWAKERIAAAGKPKFRLNGFQLERIAQTAG